MKQADEFPSRSIQYPGIAAYRSWVCSRPGFAVLGFTPQQIDAFYTAAAAMYRPAKYLEINRLVLGAKDCIQNNICLNAIPEIIGVVYAVASQIEIGLSPRQP